MVFFQDLKYFFSKNYPFLPKNFRTNFFQLNSILPPFTMIATEMAQPQLLKIGEKEPSELLEDFKLKTPA